ncbi:MAG: FMN-binding protein [Treponema sp.]|jgi:uncharacterized protein with FMN-binding domain|nr:FMN-binding protein [Treponema sp.]
MIRIKKLLVFLLIVLSLGMGFVACSNDSPEEDTRYPPYGIAPDYYTGTVESDTKIGMHMEGQCSVKISLTLVGGYITEVSFLEATGHSETLGKRLVIEKAPAEIVAKNSVEIDAVSSATVSRNLVVSAGKAALAKIPGYVP